MSTATDINCGVSALSKLSKLKNISAFTLVHMARDNGLDLSVFKVNKLEDLPRVIRPAIFHQKDHFIYVRPDEALPEGEYTGYVLGTVVLGRVIGLSEAKFITGQKNFLTGKNKDGEQTGHGALIDIIAVAASIITVNPLVGAAISAGGGAIERAQNQDVLGSPYNPGAIAVDAVKGYAEGAGAIGGVQGFTAGGGLNNGIGQAAVNTAKGALQGETQSFSHPIATSAHGLAIDTTGIAGSTGSQLAAFNAAKGIGTSAAAPGVGANASTAFNAASPAMSLASGGVGNAAGDAISNVGNFSLSNFKPNPTFSTTALKSVVAPASQSIFSNVGNAITSNPIGSAATLAGAAGVVGSKPPSYNAASPTDNYSAVNTFVGSTPQGQANGTFGLASAKQNTDYVNTPISDLQKQFTGNNQRTLDTINTAYDNQRQQLTHQYAQAGQNLSNSSELQDKVGQLEQKRTNDLTLAQQELTDQALGQAIQVKQQALSSGMQAGQWNQTLAFELASLTGDQQNLQYAIANNDYESFQQIMGKLMTMGIPQTTKTV